jgi:serine protease Do
MHTQHGGRVAALTAMVLLSASGVGFAQDANLKLRRTPIVEVFEKTRGAVVNIACTQDVQQSGGLADPFQQFFDFRSPLFPHPRQREITSVGSGFVLHPDGYIVTNAHVVLRTVDQKVKFVDGDEFSARPVAIDTDNDLAVLKIDSPEPHPAMTLGRSNDLMIGETVVAIGNPFRYQHTLTAGVISAVNRTLRFDNGVRYTGLIQTDAPINPGNSGGPLLNILGELIGITTAIRSDAQNIGFAIPVDTLRRVLPEMLSLERLKRVRIGMKVAGRDRVRVVEVAVGSPAQAAGIQPGDQIARMNERRITQDIDFYVSLLGKKAGDTIDLELVRDGKSHEATLTLQAIPIPDGAKLARELFGLGLEPLPKELAQEFLEQFELRGGLVVMDVERGSPADRAGIEPGMLVINIGGDFPTDMDHVGLLLETVRTGDVVRFQIWQVGRRVIRSHVIRLRAR